MPRISVNGASAVYNVTVTATATKTDIDLLGAPASFTNGASRVILERVNMNDDLAARVQWATDGNAVTAVTPATGAATANTAIIGGTEPLIIDATGTNEKITDLSITATGTDVKINVMAFE